MSDVREVKPYVLDIKNCKTCPYPIVYGKDDVWCDNDAGPAVTPLVTKPGSTELADVPPPAWCPLRELPVTLRVPGSVPLP